MYDASESTTEYIKNKPIVLQQLFTLLALTAAL